MDAKLINPFLNAIVKVIKTMAYLDVEVGKPYLKKNSMLQGDVSGIVGLTGDVTGSIAMSYKNECILNIVSNMLGEKFVEVNDDIADAVGELTNMISGQGRKALDEADINVKGSIPTVFIGEGHKIIQQAGGPKIGVPFKVGNSSFAFEICLIAKK